MLGCGALIVVHGMVTLYFFRKYKGMVQAMEIMERTAVAGHRSATSPPPGPYQL